MRKGGGSRPVRLWNKERKIILIIEQLGDEGKALIRQYHVPRSSQRSQKSRGGPKRRTVAAEKDNEIQLRIEKVQPHSECAGTEEGVKSVQS